MEEGKVCELVGLQALEATPSIVVMRVGSCGGNHHNASGFAAGEVDESLVDSLIKASPASEDEGALFRSNLLSLRLECEPRDTNQAEGPLSRCHDAFSHIQARWQRVSHDRPLFCLGREASLLQAPFRPRSKIESILCLEGQWEEILFL